VADRFAIAQVAPHPLEDANEVGTFASEVSRELAARGHKVLLLAPSRSPELVRESRRLIRAAREHPEELFDPEGVTLIEWSERIAGSLPLERWVVTARHVAETRREYGIRSTHRDAGRRMVELKAVLRAE
jgi:hypothetical protein